MIMDEYKTGLEFLNEAPYAERAQEMKEMCAHISFERNV